MPLSLLSSSTSHSKSQTTLPLTPSNLTFISATVNSITFSFTPPSGTITGYTTTVVTDDANNTTVTGFGTTGTSSSFQVYNLPTAFQGYKISIIAINIVGNSPPGILRALTLPYYTTLTSITVPSPTDPTNPGNRWLLINFSPSVNNGGTITQFVINNTTNSTNTTVSNTSLRSYYIGSLSGNVQYNFTITTYLSFTNASSVTTTTTTVSNTSTKYTLPDAPVITGFANNGPYSMLVYFNTVTGQSGYPNYTWFYGFVNGNTNTAVPNSVKRLVSPVDVFGLSSGSGYSFTVAAQNASGYSAFSSSASASTNGGNYNGGFNQLMYYLNFEQDQTNLSGNYNSNAVTGNYGWTPNSNSCAAGNHCSLTSNSKYGTRALYFSYGTPFVIYFTVSNTWQGFSMCCWMNCFAQFNGGNARTIQLTNWNAWDGQPGSWGNSSYYMLSFFNSYQFNYNQYYHLAWVWDGKGTAINTYINGVFCATAYRDDDTNTANVGVNQSISFGATWPNDAIDSANNLYYDEIQGYNIPLNQSQVAWIMNNPGSWISY